MAPICSVCGKELKNPNLKSHINSDFHQKALHGVKSDGKPVKETKKKTIHKPKELILRIEALEKRVSDLESLISSNQKRIIKQSIPIKIMNLEDFRIILKQVYNNIPNKVGDMAAIPVIVKEIKNQTGLSSKDIEESIYKLFVKNLVDLQPGKARLGKPIAINGYNFYWLRILEG